MPFDIDAAKNHMRNLGLEDDSPEMKALMTFAEITKPEQRPQVGWGQAGLTALLAGGQAGLARIGGADHNSAVSQALGSVNGLSDANQEFWKAQQKWQHDMGMAIMNQGLSAADRKRKQQLMEGILHPGGAGPAGSIHNPGASGVSGRSAGTGSSGAPSPAAIAPAAPGGLPQVPGITVTPPTGMPQGAPPQAAGPSPMPQSSQPVGGGAPPSMPMSGRDASLVPKHTVTEDDLEALPYTPEQITAASMVDDKIADNMRQINDMVIKRRGQQIELGTMMTKRQEIDPAKAAALAAARKTAEAETERQQAFKTAGISSQGVGAMLQDMYDMPDQPDMQRSFGAAIGRMENYEPWGVPIGSALTALHEGWNALKMSDGRDAWSIRDKIRGDSAALAAKMKEQVRKPGEGAWSDKDQEALENVTGQLHLASNDDDFRARLGDLRNRLQKAFVGPMGIKMPELRRSKDQPADGAPVGDPGSDPTAAGGAAASPAGPMREGATATNPTTGEKVVFQGGQWVPVPMSKPMNRAGAIMNSRSP